VTKINLFQKSMTEELFVFYQINVTYKKKN